MKKLILATIATLCLVVTSCDSNKDKVKSMTNEFITAVNEKDNVTINELYPERKGCPNLVVSPSINTNGIDVSFNETDSLYTAKINDKQSLVFKLNGKDSLQIYDSYGILQLDSVTYELAAKIGAPVKKNSDLTNGKLFAEDGDLLSYLANMNTMVLNGNLYVDPSGRYSWGRNYGSFYCNYENSIRNIGDTEVSGDEYDILIEFYSVNPYENVGRESLSGCTIAPNSTEVITGSRSSLYNYANAKNLTWNVTLNFKNKSKCTMLEKYGKSSGNEYEDYVDFIEQQKAMTDQLPSADAEKVE